MSALALPGLRQELAIHAGARLLDGQPSWTLQDPVRNLFFRIDWLTFEILSHWDAGDAERVARAVRDATPLDARVEDVAAVAEFLLKNELLQPRPSDGAALLARVARARRSSWWKWLLHHYLFFRVPIARPDRLLGKAVQVTPWLFSRAFALATLCAFVAGAMLIYRQWDGFSTTLVDTFSPAGLASYAIAFAFVKVLHELGHGLVARRNGCRVPAMGIAFMVLWPVPYTDVNEAWKLGDRRARLRVAAAGVATELVIAVWMTLAWGLLEDGLLRSAAFLLATTTWVSTLAVNLSPFMRFDGYFVLSDFLDVPNLHGRSFALARWKLREWLFDLREPAPEAFPRARAAGLIAFAWVTWIYRLVVFLGIAVLVYAFFIKLVGILLFVVEIAWFVALPVLSELRAWRERLPAIRATARTRATLALLSAALLVLVIPLPWTIRAAGVLHPGEEHAVFAREAARVEAIHVRDGAAVARETPLFTLDSAELNDRLQGARGRVERLEAQSHAAAVSPELRSRLLVHLADLEAARASLRGLESQIAEQRLAAPAAGRVHVADPDLRPGTWVARHERLATVLAEGPWHVEAYIDEKDLQRIAEGGRARFFSEGGWGWPLSLTVRSIDRDATRALPSGLFSQAQGGSVPTREAEGRFLPEKAVYRVRLEAEGTRESLTGRTSRGTVVLYADAESLGARALRAAMSVLWREAGW